MRREKREERKKDTGRLRKFCARASRREGFAAKSKARKSRKTDGQEFYTSYSSQYGSQGWDVAARCVAEFDPGADSFVLVFVWLCV